MVLSLYYHGFRLLLCIRKCGTLVFFKIAITYLKYNEFLYIGKKCETGHTSNLGLILKHIINSVGV